MKKILLLLSIFCGALLYAQEPVQELNSRLKLKYYPEMISADSVLVTNGTKEIGFVSKSALEQTLSLVGTQITISGQNTIDLAPLVGDSALWGSITGLLSDQTDLQNALNAKQETLISGSNIRTINGLDVMGSGNLVISAQGGEANDLTQSVTWTEVPIEYIPEDEITITESQISDLQHTVDNNTTYTAGDGLTLTDTDFGIADAGVTNLKLQNGSVTNDKIAFFTINPTRLNVNVNQNPVPADMVPVTLAADEFTFKPYITSPFSSIITGYRFAPNLLYFDQIHIKNKTQGNSVATSSIALSSVEDPDNSGDYYGYIGLAKPSTGAGDRITGVPSSYSVLGTTNNVKIGQATPTAPVEKLFVEGNVNITGDYLINGTPIGSGGGTDDQTLPEVLTEGNDAGGEDVLNVGILNLSDKNSDTGTWDITEQTSSTYSGDLAFRNSSAGSSINRAFIPHDGIIEFSAHLTTKFYVDNAISNSGGGSDSGQGKQSLESGTTGSLVTYNNNNVTVDGTERAKGVINEIFAQDTISLSGVTLKNFWIPIQNYTDSLRLIRNADEWFDVKDSVLKSTDFLKTGQKEMILARYRKDSANIKLWEIKVPSYVLADTTSAYVNPNPELFDLTYASTIGSGSNNVRTPSSGLQKIAESTGATFDVVFDDTVPTGDDYVIEVTANNTGSNERARHFLSPVTVGEVYEYKIWMKVTENPGNGRLIRYDGVDVENIVYGATNTDWQLFEGEFTAQATEVQLNYGFVANEATASKIRVKASMKLKDD